VVKQPLGLSSPHGEEAGWVMAVLRQLPPTQQRHRSRHIPAAKHVGFFSSRVAGCSLFTKIDLRKGYYQIPMHPADILKTAIITPFGLFKFLRLTFGLRNAGSTLEAAHIIIASPFMEQH
jgi:hypothetical protein